MAAMQWPIEILGLDRLVLDPRNVRVRSGRGDGLADEPHTAADKAIARYMVEAEDLVDLIRDILRDGYLDNEIPVVVADGDRFVVLEGNRRVTALKVIETPKLLGKEAAKRVERLIVRYPDHDSPKAIRVMVAPSREAALPLLARLHTGSPKKSWLREQQAIFYHAQLSSDVTVDDLRVQYPTEASSLPKKIRLGEMREVIRSLDYRDTDLRDFVMNSELKMTSFEYAYQPKKLASALGLVFSNDGLLASKNLSEGQGRALAYLLGRFKDGTLNTRSPELIAKNAVEHERLADDLRRIVAGESPSEQRRDSSDADGRDGEEPEARALGETNGSDDGANDGAGNRSGGASGSGTGAVGSGGETAGSVGAVAGGGARGSNRGDTKSRLGFEGFEYGGASAGMRRRFEELKRLDLRDFPNAAHDLLRTILECSIKDYFKAKGTPLEPKQTIGPCLRALAQDFQDNARMTALINTINRKGRMTTEQFAGTTDSLSASNHEPDHFAEGADVHAAWDRLKPILIEIVGTKTAVS